MKIWSINNKHKMYDFFDVNINKRMSFYFEYEEELHESFGFFWDEYLVHSCYVDEYNCYCSFCLDEDDQIIEGANHVKSLKSLIARIEKDEIIKKIVYTKNENKKRRM